MTDHDGNHRYLVEKNVPIELILPSRWQDGDESLGMETTSCQWLWCPSTWKIWCPKEVKTLCHVLMSWRHANIMSMWRNHWDYSCSFLEEGDEQLDRPNSQAWMEWCHKPYCILFWICHKTAYQLDRSIRHILLPTKELHIYSLQIEKMLQVYAVTCS